MRLTKKIFMLMTLWVSIAFNVSTANYSQQSNYRIYANSAAINVNGIAEVTLLLDVPSGYNLMKRAFQVDVKVPDGYQPVVSNGHYAIPESGFTIKDYWTGLTQGNKVRLVFTASEPLPPVQGRPIAVMQIKEITKKTDASILFSNFIFQRSSGYYGANSNIKIKPFVYPEGLSIDKTTLKMYIGDVQQIKATRQPSSCESTIKWSTSDSGVATVDATGKVTARGAGTATVTATMTDPTENGTILTAVCNVTVLRENDLLVDTLTHVRGTTRQSRTVNVSLVNRKPISAVQFDLSLPSYMTMAYVDGYPDIWLDDGRRARNHSVDINSTGSKTYRVIVSSPTSRTFSGNDGAILHFNVLIDQYPGSTGNYSIKLENVVLAEADETQHTISSITGNVKYGYLVGDANADTHVDVSDYVLTANKILQRSVNNYWSDAANVNGDASVNVTDLVGITNIALDLRQKEIRPAPAAHAAGRVTLGVEGDCEANALCLTLDNHAPLAALQADLTLPAGITVTAAEAAGRAARYAVEMAELPDGRLRLLLSHFGGDVIGAGSGEVVRLRLSGTSASDAWLDVDEIVAVTRDLATYYPAAISLPINGLTGIDAPSASAARVYVENGAIAIDSPVACTAALVTVDGRSMPLAVAAGHNTFAVAGHGVYIVWIDGRAVKLAL